MWLLLLALRAGATEAGPEVWNGILDARLMESLERDPGTAMNAYDALLQDLSDDDPLAGELLFWMGRAAFEAGDVDRSLELLRRSVRSSRPHPDAAMLLARIRMEARRVAALPYQQDFSEGTGGWVRGWVRREAEELTTVDLDGAGGRALAWRTDVREGETDFIVLAFGDLPRGPVRLKMLIRAGVFPAHIRILAEDEEGRRWTAPVVVADTRDWLAVDLPFNTFVPAEAPAARRRFDPRTIRRLIVRDVSAFHETQRGPNTIYVDDVEIR